MRRGQTRRFSNVQIGMFALLVAIVVTYFGFTKAIPFRDHYEIKAAVATSNNLRTNSFVRIAGVNVGKVTKVDHFKKGSDGALVTMRIDKKGLPIHKDATVSIRPRIFLEGNFFVDLEPGTPSSPELEDGGVIPVNQTKTPVQLDQILTALQSDTREDLKVLLEELSQGVDGQGSEGYRRSIRYWKDAYKGSAIVNDATLGKLEHDLSDYIDKSGVVAEALDRNSGQLKSLVTDFNTTAGAFARESSNLESAIAELPRTLAAGEPALAALNASFPPLRRLVRDFRPAVRSSGPALEAGTPFLAQLRLLVGKDELQGLASELRKGVDDLSGLTRDNKPLMEQVSLASNCQNDVILPWTQDTVPDDKFPAKGPVYQEGVQFLPGIAGESRSGDANGQWFRIQAGGGNFTIATGNGVFAPLLFPIEGINPPRPPRRPENRPDVPCETQEKPNLDTNTLPVPAGLQRKNPPLKGKALERYEKARQAFLDWTREQLKREGLTSQIKLLDRDATVEDIKKVVARNKVLTDKVQALIRRQQPR